MATSMEVRLVSVNTRDGVDTRNQDLTACLEVRSQDRDEQTAALTYLMPPGADVPGSILSAYWSNYLRTAEAYIKGDPLDFFKFSSFEDQQQLNENDIARECRHLGTGEEMLNVFRQFYNREVTDYLSKVNDPSTSERSIQLTLEFAKNQLDLYNTELAEQNKAAALIQKAYRASKMDKCTKCDEKRMGDFTELCVDCYWEEDAAIKKVCRFTRQNAITVGVALVDVTALVNRAIDMTGQPEWEDFWAKYQHSNMKIRIPKPKKPCNCGAESTDKVNGRRMCGPCSDYVQNVGECRDCGIVGPRPQRDRIRQDRCFDCWDEYLDYIDREEESRRCDAWLF